MAYQSLSIPYKNPDLMSLMPKMAPSVLPKSGMSQVPLIDSSNVAPAPGMWDSMKGYASKIKDSLSGIGGKDSMFNSESMFGEKGWVAPTMQGLGSLASGWAALGQYGVAKDSLAMQQDAFNKNYVAQGRLTNAQLADQQTRNLGNMSPERQAQALTADDYVKKYGVANV